MARDDEDDDEDGYANKPTPPLRKTRYAMPADERDSAAHRRAEQRAVTESERRRHAEMYASGMPVVIPQPPDEEPDTGPVAMLEAIELDAEDFQQIHRLRRESPDPAVGTYKLAKQHRQLRKEIRALVHEERSNNEARANQLIDLLNRPPDERTVDLERRLNERIAALGRKLNDLEPVRKGLRWLQASLVLVILGIGGWLYARGGKETAIDMRIEELREAVRELKTQIERLNDHQRREAPRDPHP